MQLFKALFIPGCRVALLACLLGLPALAQTNTASERELKVAYLYHIINFVTWPGETQQPIEICVYADDAFNSAVKPLEQREIRNRRIHLRYLTDLHAVTDCDLLYVRYSTQLKFSEVFNEAHRSNVLTLGDSEHFAEQGGMIGFVVHESRVRLVINLDAIEESKLKVSAKLLEIAYRVIGDVGGAR